MTKGSLCSATRSVPSELQAENDQLRQQVAEVAGPNPFPANRSTDRGLSEGRFHFV